MKFTLKIKKNNTIKYVLKKGRYYIAKNITVHASKILNDKDENNYIAICVSHKNGISVHRNKMKRWVREVYKQEEEKIKKGYNIVFLYKKTTNIENIDFNKIYDDIKICFKGLGLYKDEL